MFMDECHFYQHGTRISAWHPPEDMGPVVLQEPNRKGISVFKAVRIRYGRLLTESTERYNALTFLKLLSIAHARFPDSIFVLDNAQYHHASLITDYAFLADINLLSLPQYSPELNPIERVWKIVKKHATHNRYFQLLDDLKSALLDKFARHFEPNDELRNLYVITYVVMYNWSCIFSPLKSELCRNSSILQQIQYTIC